MIQVKTSQFFEAKIRYEAYVEHTAKAKKISQSFVIDAMTFAEAEARVTEHVMSKFTGEDIFYVKDTFEILTITKATYKNILSADTEGDDNRFFKCKISILYTDDVGEDKKYPEIHLVKASCLDSALKIITEHYAGDMRDYERSAITETNIKESIEQPTSI
jgi:hypothetical protein